MKQKNLTRILLAIFLATSYALVVRYLYGVEDWRSFYSVMSVSFLFLVPVIVGGLAVYFSNDDLARKWTYQIFFPWVPIFLFFMVTLVLAWEGFACWIMVLPLFLIAASIGGLIGGALKKQYNRKELKLSLLVLLPFCLSPVESYIGSIPAVYEAYTYIDIEAPAEEIWSEVTRVREIAPEDDQGWLSKFLGFPRPLRAELNYEGVGAQREAIFTNGLVFHEEVLEYEHQKRMVFSIDADPQEIPSTTLDEHVVVGGQFFDVLTGTYELEALSPTTQRLHLYSRFELNTTFNFYAGLWARWIMKDIQRNILQVEKRRAEGEY
ncbi:MAG: hypothetical protein KDC44_16605 [Phaeodactylibacter sp.]|nr:hypothetical protein [Phaeodactylibacter sp.]